MRNEAGRCAYAPLCRPHGPSLFHVSVPPHGCRYRKVRRLKKAPPLVLIEWEDSAQPVSNWQHVSEVKVSAVRIASVGWLVKDGKKVKGLAPNVGGLRGKGSPQCSGVIAIPTRCVIQIKSLDEGADHAA